MKVSLHDCLACSGCVTSAETVLLQHQSLEEFTARLRDPACTVVVSLSSQSIVSLATAYGMHPGDCAARLTGALKASGVAAVFDITWARDVALLETAAEFIDRYRQESSGAQPSWENGAAKPLQRIREASSSALPMLASACPGWVCYAEKTHGAFVLPHISTAKSPQAVMGTVVKRQWAPARGFDPGQVYHCSVMPCYDKKLEAAREDFNMPGGSVPETDCVLATTEVYEWLQGAGVELSSVPPAAMDAPFTNQVPGGAGQSFGSQGGSGGYLECVIRTAARTLGGIELPPGRLPMVQGRNADLREFSMEVGGHTLRFAAAYGFRNIQGLMRKVKLGRCDYDYVEVMACPSGCLNGGGQVKPAPGQSVQQLIEQLEVAYANGLMEERPAELNPSVQALYNEWVGAQPGAPAAKELLHTQYHVREKTVTGMLADW